MSAQKDTLNRRTIDFVGTRNFRDLGGIPTPSGETRYGVIYRSDRLSNLTNADGEQLHELGIATIIDMRSAEERQRAPNRLAPGTKVNQLERAFLPRHTLGMFDAINSGEYDEAATYAAMIRQYRALALEHTQDYRRIIDDLIAPGAAPAIFHCTSGKDRTGMIAAIILLALETPVDAVAADYAMTQDRIEKVDYFADTANAKAIEIVMAANPDYICAAFTAMETAFGSITLYLRNGIGVTTEKQRRLQELLVNA
jgi:protein-tyrosine phosphatase